VQSLRAAGVRFDGDIARTEPFPEAPDVDRAYFRRLAMENHANARLNAAAGRYAADTTLARKTDSLYTPAAFATVQSYLESARWEHGLYGVVYVSGPAVVQDRGRLKILDGTLVAEGSIQVSQATSLTITHSAAARALPGLLALDEGAVMVDDEARLQVHGILYAGRSLDVGDGARMEVVGAVVGNDPLISFNSFGATVIVWYDPAVLGTPGLRVPAGAPAVVWISAWEELP
jgi:hypothetical protein